MVEKLACRRSDNAYNLHIGEWQLIDTSSIEKYVSGTVELNSGAGQQIRMPFITCFLFSCTKEKNNPYKLNWSMSLS
jgi:hypothetical protein